MSDNFLNPLYQHINSLNLSLDIQLNDEKENEVFLIKDNAPIQLSKRKRISAHFKKNWCVNDFIQAKIDSQAHNILKSFIEQYTEIHPVESHFKNKGFYYVQSLHNLRNFTLSSLFEFNLAVNLKEDADHYDNETWHFIELVDAQFNPLENDLSFRSYVLLENMPQSYILDDKSDKALIKAIESAFDGYLLTMPHSN